MERTINAIRRLVDKFNQHLTSGGVVSIEGLDVWADDDGEFRVHLLADESDAYAFAYLDGLEAGEAVHVVVESGKVSGENYEGVSLADVGEGMESDA